MHKPRTTPHRHLHHTSIGGSTGERRAPMGTRGKHIFITLMLGDPGTNQELELVLILIQITLQYELVLVN